MPQISKDKKFVANMFNDIAPIYDSTGHILSLGIDKIWRKKMKKKIAKMSICPISILDIATGTGDLAIELSSLKKCNIIGIDISQNMLAIAKEKVNKKQIQNITFVDGDAMQIPFPDNSFDVVTISFGIRNFENLEVGITEIKRVLKPNGAYFILELTRPSGFVKHFYLFYLRHLLPTIGALFSKNKSAYVYLKETIHDFYQDEALNAFFIKSGFKGCRFFSYSFGLSTLYTGVK